MDSVEAKAFGYWTERKDLHLGHQLLPMKVGLQNVADLKSCFHSLGSVFQRNFHVPEVNPSGISAHDEEAWGSLRVDHAGNWELQGEGWTAGYDDYHLKLQKGLETQLEMEF